MFKNNIGRLIVAAIVFWTGSANAGLIKYEITLDSDNSLLGYVVFNDSGPVPGDIISDLVDWSFSYGGVEVNSSNTDVSDDSRFDVDAGFQPDLYPSLCFKPGGGSCQGIINDPLTGPTFAIAPAGTLFAYMGDAENLVIPLEAAGISGPIAMAPIPLSSSLLGLGLLVLGFHRRKFTANV